MIGIEIKCNCNCGLIEGDRFNDEFITSRMQQRRIELGTNWYKQTPLLTCAEMNIPGTIIEIERWNSELKIKKKREEGIPYNLVEADFL